MDVSIVIVNYNTFDLTYKCIASVLEKTTDLVYEIILVDNASTEIDPDNFLKHYPNIVLIKNAENCGFSKGNNVGVAKARGRNVLLLNSDTELKNNAIQICNSVLDSDKRMAVISCRLEFSNGAVQHNCQRFPSLRYKIIELLRIQKILPAKTRGKLLQGFFFNYSESINPDWVWGTFFMFRKELLLSLPEKKLNEQYFMYGEDMQWCYDFRKLGYCIAFEPRAKVIHHMGMSGGKKDEMMRENLTIFMRQHYSPIKIWILNIVDRLLVLGR